MLAGINDVGTILVLEGWWFQSGIGRCAHDGLSWWPAVVRMAEDAKGATLKWEPVWHHRRKGWFAVEGRYRRMEFGGGNGVAIAGMDGSMVS